MNTPNFRLSWALVGAASVVLLSACHRDNPAPADSSSSSTVTAGTPSASSDFSQPALIETIYVPGPDDKLHPKQVSFKSIEVPASALQEIVSSAPKWFPKGAKVNNIIEGNKQITVDINKTFGEQSFWGERGEKTTELVVYALVNSASAKSKKPVQLTIEGQPVGSLGDFDASDAIEPRPDIIVNTPLKPDGSLAKPTTKPTSKPHS